MKPYGYVRKDGEGLFIYGEHQFQNAMDAELVPVYTHPKELVGLTEEERKEIWNVGEKKDQAWRALLIQAIHNIEAKLKEKNT